MNCTGGLASVLILNSYTTISAANDAINISVIVPWFCGLWPGADADAHVMKFIFCRSKY